MWRASRPGTARRRFVAVLVVSSPADGGTSGRRLSCGPRIESKTPCPPDQDPAARPAGAGWPAGQRHRLRRAHAAAADGSITDPRPPCRLRPPAAAAAPGGARRHAAGLPQLPRPARRAAAWCWAHGSSADSRSRHLLARALAQAGLATYALDMRGPGGSGSKGHIGHVGQLDEDLEDFVRTLEPVRPRTLTGFSAGAASRCASAAASGRRCSTATCCWRPAEPGRAHLPARQRRLGQRRRAAHRRSEPAERHRVHALDGLTVRRFALNEQAQAMLTPPTRTRWR